MDKVSIVIAAYNIQDYIGRCLDSVINQTYKNIDIIVVNDGSTDKTLSIINSYANNDDRLKIIDQKNMGLLASRKVGFNHATGEYILFIDGDDWLELNAIEIMYNSIKKDNYDIVQCKYFIKGDSGRVLKDIDKNLGVIEADTLIKKLLLSQINHNIWTKLIKMDYIKDNNIHFMEEITYGEDLAFTFELFMRKPKILIIENCLYNYFQRSDSLTKVISTKVLEINNVLRHIKDELINNQLYSNYIEEFEYFVYRHAYLSYQNYIFYSQSELAKSLLLEWKNYNICIKKNKFYKENIKFNQKISYSLYNNELFSYPYACIVKNINYFIKLVKTYFKPYLRPLIIKYSELTIK